MGFSNLQDIEQAIRNLEPRQLEELSRWFEQHYGNAIDSRLESDLAAGRIDSAIDRALTDEQHGRVRPL